MTSRAPADMLPPKRSEGAAYRIAVVCLGNICRSPIAEVVLTSRIDAAGLAGRVAVVSAGTGDWHAGKPMDHRAATVLNAHGYDTSRHLATQFESAWLDEYDLVLAMDTDNYLHINALASPGADASRVRMFRDFDPRAHDGDRDVPDPYYGGDDGFDFVLTMVERTSAAIVAALSHGVFGD